MNRQKTQSRAAGEFWFFPLSLFCLRAADVGITYAVSPDLRWEINPLVSVAGFGWFTLLLYNVIGVVLAVLLFHYSLFKGDVPYPPPGYSQKEFISHYLFGERNSFRKIYYVVPHNKKAIIQYCGYVFIRVLTVWSLFVVIHNALIWYSEPFRDIMSNLKLWLSVYGLLILLVPLYSLLFFRALYTQYRS
jgi:hypothetical protein